jgi:predicted P-loop ATPase
VLEGPEGRNKSTAIETMAGKENFSDQHILGVSDKEAQENLQGVWLYEIADLTGIRKADADKVKAFASRTTDRARPAYGRFRLDQKRRCVIFASTNDEQYLQSHNGNRRFWPIKTGEIDIARLKADRDQLWAEAAHQEAKGVSIVLPKALWADATAEQAKRLEHDAWEDLLASVSGAVVRDSSGGGWREQITSADLLSHHLKLSADRITGTTGKRLKTIMERLGWEYRAHARFGDKAGVAGYVRPAEAPAATEPQILDLDAPGF